KDGTAFTLAIGEVTESANVSAANTTSGAFPTWVSANYNSGCSGFSTGGASAMRLTDANFYINRWKSPTAGAMSDASFGSQHAGGAHFCMCDGTVRFINQNIDATNVYKPLGARRDGLNIGEFYVL